MIAQPRFHSGQDSLSRRFSYILTGVIACLVGIFSTVSIWFNLAHTEARLQAQLTRTTHLAQTSLASAVWQVSEAMVADVLETIFTEDAIVYARVCADQEVFGLKTAPEFAGRDFTFFQAAVEFITQTEPIMKDGEQLGIFQFAISRQKIQRELLRGMLNSLGLMLAIIISVSTTSIYLTKRYVLRPLADLVTAATLIANGQFDTPILAARMLTQRHDEIGELARTFDHTRERLLELMSHLRQADDMMQTASEGTLQAVNQLAAALEEQAASTVETTATMESMTKTSRQISGNTDAVATMAEQTRMDSLKGVSMADKLTTKMRDIQETNTQFLQKIMLLGERSETIGNVIEFISDIADRAKLIAFNAALESAGSSESGGKRFQVVAAEIRRLADSIIESTQEINSNIFDIQQGIRELVISSDATTSRIMDGAHETMTLRDWLHDILIAAHRTTDEARQIAAATQEQQYAHEQILLSLKEIADSSKQFISVSTQVSRAADDMKQLAQTLDTLLNTFSQQHEEARS